MNLIEELGRKYGTDKVTKHHYQDVYYELFKDRRKSVKKVLEIGVAEGAGLRMFRDFFPNAMIYGAEIDSKRVFDGDRLQVFKCDQSKEADIRRLLQRTGFLFDLIIDDGSHKPQDQIFTCLEIMFKVSPDVTYVIEDVADLSIVEKLNNYYCKVFKVGERYDDRLVIVKKL